MQPAAPPIAGGDGMFDLSTVLGVVITMQALGYAARATRMIDGASEYGLSCYVSFIALPALLFRSIATLEASSVLWPVVLGVLATKALVFAFSIALAALLSPRSRDPSRRHALALAGSLSLCLTNQDDIGLGLPLFTALSWYFHQGYLDLVLVLAAVHSILFQPATFVLLGAAKMLEMERPSPVIAAAKNSAKLGTHLGPTTAAELSAQMPPKNPVKSEGCFAGIQLVGGVFRGLRRNPLVLSVLGGALYRSLLPWESDTPSPSLHWLLESTTEMLGRAFTPLVLFLAGTSSVSAFASLRKLEQAGLPAALAATKLLLTPIIARSFALMFSAAPASLDFVWLYSMLPVANSSFAIARSYTLSEELLDSIATTTALMRAASYLLLFFAAAMLELRADLGALLGIVAETSRGAHSISAGGCLPLLLALTLGHISKPGPQRRLLILAALQFAHSAAFLTTAWRCGALPEPLLMPTGADGARSSDGGLMHAFVPACGAHALSAAIGAVGVLRWAVDLWLCLMVCQQRRAVEADVRREPSRKLVWDLALTAAVAAAMGLLPLFEPPLRWREGSRGEGDGGGGCALLAAPRGAVYFTADLVVRSALFVALASSIRHILQVSQDADAYETPRAPSAAPVAATAEMARRLTLAQAGRVHARDQREKASESHPILSGGSGGEGGAYILLDDDRKGSGSPILLREGSPDSSLSPSLSSSRPETPPPAANVAAPMESRAAEGNAAEGSAVEGSAVEGGTISAIRPPPPVIRNPSTVSPLQSELVGTRPGVTAIPHPFIPSAGRTPPSAPSGLHRGVGFKTSILRGVPMVKSASTGDLPEPVPPSEKRRRDARPPKQLKVGLRVQVLGVYLCVRCLGQVALSLWIGQTVTNTNAQLLVLLTALKDGQGFVTFLLFGLLPELYAPVLSRIRPAADSLRRHECEASDALVGSDVASPVRIAESNARGAVIVAPLPAQQSQIVASDSASWASINELCERFETPRGGPLGARDLEKRERSRLSERRAAIPAAVGARRVPLPHARGIEQPFMGAWPGRRPAEGARRREQEGGGRLRHDGKRAMHLL